MHDSVEWIDLLSSVATSRDSNGVTLYVVCNCLIVALPWWALSGQHIQFKKMPFFS